jgi:phosphate transport system protein
MGGKVEQMITDSIKALTERDSKLALKVIARDHEVNYYEVMIDESCLELLAKRRPVGRDLRYITLALKIVTDLERIGDKCANIAKRVCKLNDEPPLDTKADIPRLANSVSIMLKEALDSYVRLDAELAKKVCANDRNVNKIYDFIQQDFLDFMLEDSKAIKRLLKLQYVAKSLERVADHATNIAEMVIFIVKGKDIRHIKAPHQNCLQVPVVTTGLPF